MYKGTTSTIYIYNIHNILHPKQIRCIPPNIFQDPITDITDLQLGRFGFSWVYHIDPAREDSPGMMGIFDLGNHPETGWW
jgi:hypothetical protein